MSLRNSDAPPAPGPAPWPGSAARQRARPGSRAWALGLAGALLLPLLAAWAVPPALDWGRYRTGIAAIAAAQLGRPVVISGEVTLRLLPEAVLTAAGVVLPDQGDGVSAALSTLRLQVAVLPMLAGRITLRDLVLGAPVVQLPWPLPDSLVHPAGGRVARAFAAHIENGTLRVGRAQVTGINAGIHDGPEPSASPGLLPETNAAGFGAEGFAAFAGRNWRFTGALGLPDADGVSALDLAVSGQGAAARTNATLQGTVAGGLVQGRLHAGGPDLSLLIPAAALAWQVDAPFIASGTSIEAASIDVALGGSRAEAALSLRVAAPARLDGRVHAASIDLDSWVRLLGAGGAGGGVYPTVAKIPGRIEVTADTARLLGGMLAGLHGALASDGKALMLDHAGATLPGQARLQLGGTITRAAGVLQISGPARLDAPALRDTLHWLHGLAPALVDALPGGVLRTAALSGTVTAGPGYLSVTGLAGQLDGTGVSGGFGFGLGARPGIRAGLALDRLEVDDWTGPGLPAPGALVRTGQFWSRFDGDIHMTASEGSLHGLVLHGLALDAHMRASGLRVDRAAAELAGVHLTASGSAAPDGALADVTFRAETGEAATLSAVLPPEWRRTAGLWRGPASMEATLAGPPNRVSAQLRTDIGDLVAETELRADIDSRVASGSITLRHPGAPRLLASLGVSGAERWLDTGSVALRGTLAVQPGHVSLRDLDLIAADLRLGGSLDVDITDSGPSLHGAIDAARLALPGWPMAWRPDPAWLRGWAAQLHLKAGDVTIGRLPIARSVVADVGLQSGMALVDVVEASVAGGKLTGQIAVDASPSRPLVAFHGQAAGLHVPGPLTGWPVDLAAGTVDVAADAELTGDGAALDQVAGTAALAVRDGQLAGLDLAAATRASSQRGAAARQTIRAALAHGTSGGLAGAAAFEVARGMWHLTSATLVSPDGTIVAKGAADQAGLSMRLDLAPSGVSIVQAGPWTAIRVSADPGPAATPVRPKGGRHG